MTSRTKQWRPILKKKWTVIGPNGQGVRRRILNRSIGDQAHGLRHFDNALQVFLKPQNGEGKMNPGAFLRKRLSPFNQLRIKRGSDSSVFDMKIQGPF